MLASDVVCSRASRPARSVAAVLAAALWLAAACSCSSRGAPSATGAGPEIVEGGVIFRYYDREATTVHVVSDFNNWSPRADPMADENADGEWTLFYNVRPGVYEYKFVVNGTSWIPDPRNPESVPDGFSGRNSVLRIPKTSQ